MRTRGWYGPRASEGRSGGVLHVCGVRARRIAEVPAPHGGGGVVSCPNEPFNLSADEIERVCGAPCADSLRALSGPRFTVACGRNGDVLLLSTGGGWWGCGRVPGRTALRQVRSQEWNSVERDMFLVNAIAPVRVLALGRPERSAAGSGVAGSCLKDEVLHGRRSAATCCGTARCRKRDRHVLAHGRRVPNRDRGRRDGATPTRLLSVVSEPSATAAPPKGSTPRAWLGKFEARRGGAATVSP